MVKIILGPARSGKTRIIMNAIADITKSAIASFDRRAVLVVPEQYSHSAERELLTLCGDRLNLSAEVLSFTQLSKRAFEELGVSPRFQSLSGRMAALYRAIGETASQLKIFGRAGRRADFLSDLETTIREIRASGLSYEDIMAAAESAGGTLKIKLRDTAITLEAMTAIMQSRKEIDSTDAVTKLAEIIWDTKLAKAAIFFDGFNDFTQPEMLVIKSLIAGGADCTFCLTADSIYTENEAFALPAETARQITAFCDTLSIKYKTVTLEGGAPPEQPSPKLTIIETENERDQYEAAASLASQGISAGLRLRDIGVYSRDPGDLKKIERALARYGIPSFKSGGEALTNRNISAFLLCAIDAILSYYDSEKMLQLIKFGFIEGVSQDETDFIEIYVKKWGIRSGAWVRSRPWVMSGDKKEDAAAEAIRQKTVVALIRLSEAMRSEPLCGGKIKALYQYMEDISVPEKLSVKAAGRREYAQDRIADEYDSMWEILCVILDELYSLTGDMQADLREFRKLLHLVLSRKEISTVPIALDRVTVGDFVRSRRRDMKLLIVVGAVSEKLPAPAPAVGVFSRPERKAAASYNLVFGEDAGKTYEREANTIYSAFTLASEELILVYPQTKEPSVYIKQLSEAYGISPKRVTSDDIMVTAPIPYHEYTAMRGAERRIPFTPGQLSPETVAELYGEELRMSVTGADNFYSCAMKYFLSNGIRLHGIGTSDLDFPDIGTYRHRILEQIAADCKEKGGFSAASDGDLIAMTRSFTDSYIMHQIPGYDERSDKFKWHFERVARETENVVLDIADEARRSAFQPVSFEQEFELRISDKLTIHGTIDRIDTYEKDGERYFRIIDYKSGGRGFDISDLSAGLNMQAVIYMIAEHTLGGGASPAAALYVPSKDIMVSADRNATDAQLAKARAKSLARSGIMLSDPELQSAMDSGDPPLYLPKKKDFADKRQIELLEETVIENLIEAGEMITSGETAPYPYKKNGRMSCDFCEYISACTFGIDPNDKPRFIKRETLEREDG